jgi:galactokinase
VLGAAIERGVTVSGARLDDNLIRINSGLMGSLEIPLEDLRPQRDTIWANYVLGVARELIDARFPVRGFELQVESNLPPRCGLSSSAAFSVATALLLLRLHRYELAPMDIAKLCQRAEHQFVGVRSGLLDQVMTIFGRARNLIYFDALSNEVRLIPFPSDVALIIAQSGRERELSRSEYNLRRKQTFAAARSLGVPALRHISLEKLSARTDLDPVLLRRARHVVGEIDRVRQAVRALADSDVARIGQLMNESHESSRENFENSTSELDVLVQLAREQPGVLGARLTGAGFGGAIVALCRRERAEAAVSQLREAYLQKAGISAEMFVSGISDGAR